MGDTASNTAQDAQEGVGAQSQENQLESNTEAKNASNGTASDEAAFGMPEGGPDAAMIPAATQRINEDMALQTRTVAQAESTRSYFLAQTLESTRTVPIVSANLPLDTGSVDVVEDNNASEEEGGDEGDDPDSDGGQAPVGASFTLAQGENDSAVTAESTVIGSFTYRGITYAVEPGGESVAVVAVDYTKLPEEFIENQVIVLPSMVTADNLSYYSVTRIADCAFANLVSSVDETAIEVVAIPASITEIGDDAFIDFDTLQYVVVSEDNPNYSSYDGVLYDADQTCLLLIPGGRQEGIRVPRVTQSISEQAFSHCAFAPTLYVDPDSPVIPADDEPYRNANGEAIEIAVNDAPNNPLAMQYDYLTYLAVLDLSEEWPSLSESALTASYLDEEERNISDAYAIPAGEMVVRQATLGATSASGKYTNKAGWVVTKPTGSTATNNYTLYIYCEGDAVINDSVIVDTMRYSTSVLWQQYKSNIAKAVFDNVDSIFVAGWLAFCPNLKAAYVQGDRFLNSCKYNWDLFDEDPSLTVVGYGMRLDGAPDPTRFGLTFKNAGEADPTVKLRYLPYTFSMYSRSTYGGELAPYTIFAGTSGPLYYGGNDANTIAEIKSTGTQIPASRTLNSPIAAIWDPCNGTFTDSEFGKSGYLVNEYIIDTTLTGTGNSYVKKNANGTYTINNLPKVKDRLFSEGKQLLGWYTDYYNGDRIVEGQTYPANKDGCLFIYARWVDGVKTTWLPNGGTWTLPSGNKSTDSQTSVTEFNSNMAAARNEQVGSIAKRGYNSPTWYWVDQTDLAGNTTPRTDELVAGLLVPTDIQLNTMEARWEDKNLTNYRASYDLAGGYFEGTDSRIENPAPTSFNLKSSDIMLERPKRDGYEFAGWIRTSEVDGDEKIWGVSDDVLSDIDPISGNARTVVIPSDSIGNRTYTATWKYKVVLNLNTYDGAGNVALSGDAFEASFEGMGDFATETITIQGKPVKVYTFTVVDGQAVTLPAQVTRTGYENATRWISAASADAGKTFSGTLAAPFKPNLVSTAATAGDFGSMAFVLLADWTKDGPDGEPVSLAKTYKVTLQGDYDSFHPASGYTAELNARYDAPLLERLADGRVVVYADYHADPSKATTVEAPVIKNADGTYAYVFNGYYSEKNGLDMAEGASAWNGIEYIGAEPNSGLGGYTGSSVAPTTMLFRTANDSLVLYARWSRVESGLILDLQGGRFDTSIAGVDTTKPFTVKGLTLTANENMLALPGDYAQVPTRLGYRFRGYYAKSTKLTGNEATYAEDSTTTRFYKIGENAVVAENVKWPYYTNTTLYAHWEYDLTFDANVSNGDTMRVAYRAQSTDGGQATGSSVFTGWNAESKTASDAYGNRYVFEGDDATSPLASVTVLDGAPVALPNSVVRLRDGKVAGYDFAGFYADASCAGAKVTDSSFTASPKLVVPGAATKNAMLYAKWTPHTYTVNLIAEPSDAYTGKADRTSTGNVIGAGTLTATFDEPLLAQGDTLRVPHITGQKFLGFNGVADGSGTYYVGSATNTHVKDVDGYDVWNASALTEAFAVCGLANGATVDLYAVYEQIVYRIDFSLDGAQPADASKVDTNQAAYEQLKTEGATNAQVKAQLAEYVATYKNTFEANKLNRSNGVITPIEVTYGQSLAQDRAEENGVTRKLLPEPASGTNVLTNFWCDGYTFAGWYYIPEKEDGTLDMDARVRYSSTSSDAGARLVFDREVEAAEGAVPSITLYALWNRNSYNVRWNDHGRLAAELNTTIPYSGDVWEVLYGAYFSSRVPVAYKDRPFSGAWYNAPSGGAPVGFAPYRPASSTPTSLKSNGSYVEYFADWSRATDHVLHFYAGDGGTLGASANTTKFAYEERKDLMGASFPFRPNVKAGYNFIGWLEAQDEASALAGDVLAPSATPIRNLSEMTSSNGKAAFPRADAHVYLVAQYTTDPYTLSIDMAGGDCTDSQASLLYSFDRRSETKRLRLPDASLVSRTGYDFGGWLDGSGNSVLAYDARTGEVKSKASFIVEEDGHYYVDTDALIEAYDGVPEITFAADWKGIDYTIRFHMAKPGSGVTDQIAAELKAQVSGDPASPSIYSFPYPRGSAGAGRVFYYWGNEPESVDTSHSSWVPEAPLVFDAAFIEDNAHVTSADRTIDLYAECNGVASATVPLSVTIALAKDDGTDNMRFGNAYLSTSFDNGGVEVLSVDYEKATAADAPASGALGTDEVFGSVIGDVNLTVRAYTEDEADDYAVYREGAFTGNLDETARKALADTSLKVGLATPSTTTNSSLASQGSASRALDAFGFAPFSKGKRLNLIYGLEYTGSLTHQQFVAALRLPDANDVAAGTAHSRQSYPIAKLFYTIGLAQS